MFDIGSTSNRFTVGCLLLLAQDGALALDDAERATMAQPGTPDDGGELRYGAGLMFERPTFTGLTERLVVVPLLNRDDHPSRLARRIARLALGG